MTYEQKRLLLDSDFDRVNPITKKAGMEEFLAYLGELEQREQLPPDAELIKWKETKAKISQSEQRNVQFRRLESMQKMQEAGFRH